MPDDKCFNFLKASWGIELLDSAKEELEAHAESLSQRHIEEYLLDSDLRKFGVTSLLPRELSRSCTSELPPGKYLVQVTKIADMTQPTKFQDEFEGGKWRLLALDLTDGSQKFRGIEFGSIKDLGVHLPPGTKLLLASSQNSPLTLRNSHLLLQDSSVKVLGGNVEKLVESWYSSKEVEEKRLIWRTEGIKKKSDSGEGAPPWVDFDPKKSRPKQEMDQDYTSWRNVPGSGAGTGASRAAPERDREGPRFQMEDFAEGAEAAKVARNQVSSSVFAQNPSSSRKGGEGKGKDKGGGGKGSRRGRNDDWDGGEEKRAPQAVNTLAAFIKPTKKGELPDEALAALAEPEPAPASAGGGNTWEAGSWNQSSWGSGWAGSGWASSGRGHKGGGTRKGGGKKGGRY